MEFQICPSLKVLSNKVYKFRTFAVKLTIPASWPYKYSEDEIMLAGFEMKVRSEKNMLEDIDYCKICGKKIVEIGISSKEAFGPHIQSNGDICFMFDSCKPNCSSSRDHLHGNIILALTNLPYCPCITTQEFAIYARIAPRTKKGSSVPAEPPVAQPTVQPTVQPIAPPANTNTCKIINPNELPNLVPIKAFQELPIIESFPKIVKNKVVVHTISTTLFDDELESLALDYRTKISQIPGFIDVRVKKFSGYCIFFTYFADEDNCNFVNAFFYKYLVNDMQCKNIFDTNLINANIVQIVSVSTSYN